MKITPPVVEKKEYFLTEETILAGIHKEHDLPRKWWQSTQM